MYLAAFGKCGNKKMKFLWLAVIVSLYGGFEPDLKSFLFKKKKKEWRITVLAIADI